MFGSILRGLALLTVFAVCPLAAQENDLGLLVGAHDTDFGAPAHPSWASVSVSPSIMAAYGRRLAGYGVADLWLDIPFAVSVRGDQRLLPGISVGGGASAFFAPGVRLVLLPASRLKPYALLGGGIVSSSVGEARVGGRVLLTGHDSVSAVAGFGGGLDVRLVRFLSLRAELRDFVGRAGLDGSAGRHHAILGLGVGLHF